MGRAMNPDDIAEEILFSLGKKSLVRPGVLSKILEIALKSLIFRRLRVQMMKIIMGGMTRHQRNAVDK
jgi:hypothetical protein